MSDEALPTAAPSADLEELERRMASFESATKRLGRSVGGLADPVPPGHCSPPRPATRRLSESSAPRSDEISGFRPAITTQGPQTGALTARARSGATATPGFTSAHGKPAIPDVPTPTADQHTNQVLRAETLALRVWRRRLRWLALGCGSAALIALLLLPRLFPLLPDGAVWAEESSANAVTSGQVSSIPIRVGDHVVAGQELLRIANAPQLAPHEGTVVRLFVSVGQRLAAGEALASLAKPPVRVVASLPASLAPLVGDRVRVRLLGEDRWIDAAVEAVLEAGSPGAGNATLRRVVLLPAPSPQPLQLNQGAQSMLLGSPGTGRQLLAAIRLALPW